MVMMAPSSFSACAITGVWVDYLWRISLSHQLSIIFVVAIPIILNLCWSCHGLNSFPLFKTMQEKN